MQVTEDCKDQVDRGPPPDGGCRAAGGEASSKLSQDLKEALSARDAAQAQLKHQADALTLQLTQVQEDAARELDKAMRQEKYRSGTAAVGI